MQLLNTIELAKQKNGRAYVIVIGVAWINFAKWREGLFNDQYFSCHDMLMWHRWLICDVCLPQSESEMKTFLKQLIDFC